MKTLGGHMAFIDTTHRFGRGLVVGLAIGMALLVSAGCSDSDSTTKEAIPRQTALAGVVVDTTGATIAGVTVSANGLTATTGADGTYSIDYSASFKGVATFAKDGFVGVQKLVSVVLDAQSRLDVTLKAEGTAVVVDITEGGEASGARGAKVTIPKGGLVDSGGAAVSGEVTVSLTPFDPSLPAEFAAYPGDLRAETTDNKIVQLRTWGIMDVTIRKDGAELDVADGKTLTVQIPAPSGVTPAATTKLWSFNETRALWIEEGTATLDANTSTYTAELPHLSAWNCDDIAETTCIVGTVTDTDGHPIPGGYIKVRADDLAGEATAYGDEQGSFCIAAPVSSDVTVTVSHPDGGGAVKPVTTGPEVIDLTDDGAGGCGGDTSKCVVAGSFPVAQGVITELPPEGTTDPGTTTSCADIKDPLVGTCAEALGDIFACFDAKGECTIKSSSAGVTTTTWANGARQESTSPDGGTTTNGTFFSPSGTTCGTFKTVITATDPFEYEYTITAPSGTTWQLESRSDVGTVAICEDDTEVILTSKAGDAFEACGGGGGDNGSCTPEGGDVCESCPSGTSCCTIGSVETCVPDGQCPTGGPFCAGNSECASETPVCCDSGGGIKTCMTQTNCEQAQSAGCNLNSDCPGEDNVCCNYSGTKICVPSAACPGS